MADLTKAQLRARVTELEEKLRELQVQEAFDRSLKLRLKAIQAKLILDECNEERLSADGDFGEETIRALEEHFDL